MHFAPSHNCKYIEEMTQAEDDALATFQNKISEFIQTKVVKTISTKPQSQVAY